MINPDRTDGIKSELVRFLVALDKNVSQKTGQEIIVTSGKRTYEEQKKLYLAWIARGKTGLPASNPDKPSSHYGGNAVDVSYPGTWQYQQAAREVLKQFPNITWGIDWQGDQYDPVHFQIRNWDRPNTGYLFAFGVVGIFLYSQTKNQSKPT